MDGEINHFMFAPAFNLGLEAGVLEYFVVINLDIFDNDYSAAGLIGNLVRYVEVELFDFAVREEDFQVERVESRLGLAG